MLAQFIEGTPRDAATLLAKAQKGDNEELKTAEQFMQLFNDSVVKDFEQGVANLKGSSGLSFAGVFNNRAKAALQSRAPEVNVRPELNRESRVKPEAQKPEPSRQRAEQPKPSPAETNAVQKRPAEDRSDSSRASQPEQKPTSAKAEQKPAPGTVDNPRSAVSEKAAEPASDKQAQVETNERVQTAVRKAMFARQGEQKAQADGGTPEVKTGEKQSRLIAAISNAELRHNGAKTGAAKPATSLASATTGAEVKASAESAGQQQQQSGGMHQQNSGNGQAQQIISLQAAKPSASATAAAKAGNQFTSAMKGVMANTAKASGQAPSTAAAQQPGQAAQQSGKTAGTTRMTDSEKLVRSRQADIVKQIVRSARMISKGNGTQEMKLILKPESLGWLKMNISTQGQKMTAIITAENNNVRTMLEQNLGQLQTSLQNQNIRVQQIVVQVSGEQQQGMNMQQQGNDLLKDHQQREQHHSNGAHAHHDEAGESEAEAKPELITAQQANRLAGVDMRI